MKDGVVDVVVVGGGLAGVTTARDLSLGGFETVLVEARDRLGGRTVSQRIAGREVDTGGTYFHWFQAAIWTEVQRYELEVIERPVAERYLVGTATGLALMAPEELDARLRRALRLFWGDPSYLPTLARPFQVQGRPAVVELDRRSVDERLRELELDAIDDSLLRAVFTDFGRPLDDVSLAWVLQRASNAVWSYEAFDALFAAYRLSGGMRSLIDAMVRHGGFAVDLSSPVAGVEHRNGGGHVELADGSVIRARAIVIATPVNVWKALTFNPPLPEAHRQASREGVAAPRLSNVVMHVRGIQEALNMFAPYGDQPFEFMFTYGLTDDGQLIAGYSMDGTVTVAAGRDQLARALRRIIPEAELVDFVGHDWATDEYALGGNGSLRLGQLTRFIDVLDQPEGPLFFASGDIAPQFPGFLTGAIESGARAAHRARHALHG